MQLLSEYLAEPWDPKHRTLDKVLETALAKQQADREHRELVGKLKNLWKE
jgi:hypothetical protein